MAQNSYPLANSPILTETQWSNMAKRLVDNGVTKGAGVELWVTADSTGLKVKVLTGSAFVEGHFYESNEDEILPIGTANSTNPRIDRVILQLDRTAGNIKLAVLQGIPATNPTAPALTQNASRWEISLAQVRVNTNALTISDANITNDRTLVKNTNAVSEKYRQAVLENLWFHPPGYEVEYNKNDMNKVSIRGCAQGGTTASGTVVFTLPIGYRPPQTYTQIVLTTDSNGNILSLSAITILPDGKVSFYGGSTPNRIYFDGVTFDTE
jgi:hypothetical protein